MELILRNTSTGVSLEVHKRTLRYGEYNGVTNLSLKVATKAQGGKGILTR